jgi:hypothetical protein
MLQTMLKHNLYQREYFIQKIKEEQEHADLNIKSGDLMSAMAHKLTADWYSSMLVFTTPPPNIFNVLSP